MSAAVLASGVLQKLSWKSRYTVRFAGSEQEIQMALRLRYEVFNLELNEGLQESHATGLDRDAFDDVCEHLIVTDGHNGQVVGTYRMQTGRTAARHRGYYSEREFDFSAFEPIRESLVELGRACVHRDHRTLGVIGLLWRAIARYAKDNGARYLVGCSSLTSQDPALGWAMFARLSADYLAPAHLRTRPTGAFAVPASAPLDDCPPPPRLLRTYLGMGARICGPPAIDREFGTIDFLTILDYEKAAAAALGHFLPELS